MSDLVFHTNPASRGRIVRWMLEEIGHPYDTRVVPYGEAMKSADFLALNPMGKVPVVVHNGHVVTECAAICAYLADAFPDAGLAPRADDRAAYYRWLFFAAGPLEMAVINASFGFHLSDDPMASRRSGYGRDLEGVADALATMLADGRDYVTGARFSAADVYVGSHIQWGLEFGTMPERPGFADYAARLVARPAASAARAKDDALIAQQP